MPREDFGLLEAAGKVFAQAGFERATIRQIVAQAGVATGAVHYHYGDKAGLYRAVLDYAHRQTLDQYRDAAALSDPAARLTGFVRVMLTMGLGIGDTGAWPRRLLVNELMALDAERDVVAFRRYIRPRLQLLLGIVAELLGRPTSADCVHDHAFSLVGQCLFYARNRGVVEAAYRRALCADDLERLVAHVAQVSLAGLQADRPPGTEQPHARENAATASDRSSAS